MAETACLINGYKTVTVYLIVFEIQLYYSRITIRIVVLLAFAVHIKLIQYSDCTYYH
jgi:hypothetical protein